MEFSTRLTSRELFERLDASLTDDRAHQRRTGVVVVELDLPPAPELRQEILERLVTAARESDSVCPLTPQRYVVVVPRLKEVDALAQLVVRITAALRSPIEVLATGHECPLTVTGAISDDRSTGWSLVESALPHAHRASA